MKHQLLIKETVSHYYIGYFDLKMKDEPSDLAFRVAMSVNKLDATMEGAIACAKDMAITSGNKYKY